MGLWRYDGSWDEPGSSLAGYYFGFPTAIVSLCCLVYAQMSFITKPKAGCRTCRTSGLLGEENIFAWEAVCFCWEASTPIMLIKNNFYIQSPQGWESLKKLEGENETIKPPSLPLSQAWEKEKGKKGLGWGRWLVCVGGVTRDCFNYIIFFFFFCKYY